MAVKVRNLFALWIVAVFSGLACADVQPISEVLVTVQPTDSEQIWLRAVRVGDYEVPAEQLVTGNSTGAATAA
jgi:hypothetical protein